MLAPAARVSLLDDVASKRGQTRKSAIDVNDKNYERVPSDSTGRDRCAHEELA